MSNQLTFIQRDDVFTNTIEPDENVPGMGHVYIIKYADNITKIGRTKNLQQRIAQHRTTVPSEILEVCYTPACTNYCDLERQMHAIFRQQRIKGELFDISFDDAAVALSELHFDVDVLKQRQKNQEQAEKSDEFAYTLASKFAESIHDIYTKPQSVDVIDFFNGDQTVIDYFLEHGLSLYYVPQLNSIRVTDGNELDLGIELFFTITKLSLYAAMQDQSALA